MSDEMFLTLTGEITALRAELESLKAQEPVAFKVEYEGQDGERVVFYSDSINDFRKNPPDFGEVQSLYAFPVVTEGETRMGESHIHTDNTEALRNALARIYELESKQASTVRSGLPPFALKVIEKLRRFEECATDSDAGGVDIGRHWLDILTRLGLLNRVQGSPGLWEITAQGEDLLEPALSQQSELAVLIAEAEQRGFIRGLRAENRANAELKAQQPSAVAADERAVVMPERQFAFETDGPFKRAEKKGWNACLREFARLNPTQQAAEKGMPEWVPLTEVGQIKAGDRISFTLSGKLIEARATEVLNAGTNQEEIVYNRKKNHYFVTVMAISGESSHKSVNFTSNRLITTQQEKKG